MITKLDRYISLKLSFDKKLDIKNLGQKKSDLELLKIYIQYKIQDNNKA